VRALLAGRTDVTERRVFGGLTFMVRGHMCCGVNRDELIVRLDPDDEEAALCTPHARSMDFTNRPMTGSSRSNRPGLATANSVDSSRRRSRTRSHFQPSLRRLAAWTVRCPHRLERSLEAREDRPLNLMKAHPNDSSRRGTGDDVPRCLASMAKI
jgi:hypothetical protein